MSEPADSIGCTSHKMSAMRIAVPLGMITFATCFADEDGWLGGNKEEAQQTLQGHKGHIVHIDDYMQYAPVVAVWGLGLCGVRGKHGLWERTSTTAVAYATMGAIVCGLKYTIKEPRSDGTARNSFPSGHTATAFMGAELLREEYAGRSPWLAWSGYAVAAAVAYLRIYNNKHYANDVVAGMAIGYLSARFAYWLVPKMGLKHTGSKSRMTVLPSYTDGGLAANVTVTL